MSHIVTFTSPNGASLDAALYYDAHSNEFLVEDAITDTTVAVWSGNENGFTFVHSSIQWGSALAKSIHEYFLLRGPRVMAKYNTLH